MATTITTSQTASTLPQKKGDPPNFGTVKSGRALAFDGVVDTLTLPTTGNLEEFTTVQWVYITAHSSDGYNNLFAGNNAGSYMSVSAENKLEWYSNDSDAGNSGWIESPAIFTLNAWHRIVFTFKKNGSGGDYNAYMDGSQAGGDFPVTTDSGYTNGAMSRFASFGGTARFITGRASDLQIWDKQWTLEDVQNDYRHPEMLAHTFSGTSLTESNLLRWYPLTEGNPESPQTTIFDGSGNGNNATSVFYGNMSDLLSSSQKTALADALSSDNNYLDFATGSTNLIATNGFTASNATFVNSSGVGLLTNNASAAGTVTLPITTVAGRTYQVHFDVSGGNSNVNVSLGSSDGFVGATSSGSKDDGTGYSLATAYTADDTTSFLAIRLDSSTNTEWASLDNIYVREVGLSTTGHVEGQETIFQPAFVGQNRMIAFDGVDDIVTISDHDDFTFGDGSNDSAFSISAWICMDDAVSYSIITKGTEWSLHTQADSKLYLWIRDDSGGWNPTVNTNALSPNQWYHVVGTYDGTGGATAHTGLELYVNGSNAKVNNNPHSSYVAMEPGSSDVIIGKYSSYYANGITTEACIWNKELSLAEVQELYNNGVALDATTHSAVSNLKGYWRNNSLTTAGLWEDLSTNSHNGTLSDGSTVILPEGTTSGRDINGFFLTHPNKNWLSLDGAANVSIPNSPVLQLGNGGFSVEFWLKRHHLDYTIWIISKYDSSQDYWYITLTKNNDLAFTSEIGNVADQIDCQVDDDDSVSFNWGDIGVWHHYVFTAEREAADPSSKLIWYIDGVAFDGTYEARTNTTTSIDVDAPLSLGCQSVDAVSSYPPDDMALDDVRIYKKVLTPAEVLKNYRHGKAKHKD